MKIQQELLSEILAGKHDQAARLPSEAQLVRRFGASRPTVARAAMQAHGVPVAGDFFYEGVRGTRGWCGD